MSGSSGVQVSPRCRRSHLFWPPRTRSARPPLWRTPSGQIPAILLVAVPPRVPASPAPLQGPSGGRPGRCSPPGTRCHGGSRQHRVPVLVTRAAGRDGLAPSHLGCDRGPACPGYGESGRRGGAHPLTRGSCRWGAAALEGARTTGQRGKTPTKVARVTPLPGTLGARWGRSRLGPRSELGRLPERGAV